MRKKLLYGLIFLFIVAVSLTLYTQSRPAQGDPAQTMTAIEPRIEFEVKQGTIQNTIEVKGKSTYAEETRIYAPYNGTIRQWHVKEGSQVAEGELLFTMESDTLQKQLSLKEAEYNQLQLEKELEEAREHVLGGQDAADSERGKEGAFQRYADSKMMQLEQQMNAMRLQTVRDEMNELQTQIAESDYTAPKSGIFLFDEEKEPKHVSEEGPIGKIVELDQLEMHTTVGEYEVFKLREGMEVEIQIDALPLEQLSGTVTHVSKFAQNVNSSGSSQFPVTIELDTHESLIAGLSLTGRIVTDYKEDVIIVPTIAVQREEGEYYVDKLDGNDVKRQVVTIGLETAEHTEILEGLEAGDTVVLR